MKRTGIPAGRPVLINVDAKRFDLRRFHCPGSEIKSICKAFGLGILRSFEPEKNVRISHSNFLVYAETSRGRYALKFHPHSSANLHQHEHLLHRLLRQKGVRVPRMFSPPCLPFKHYLVTCHEWLDAVPLYGLPVSRIRGLRITEAIQSFSRSLRLLAQEGLALRRRSFAEKVRQLKDASKAYKGNTCAKGLLDDCFKVFRGAPADFSLVPLHADLSVSNILCNDREVFFIDLTHVRYACFQTDMANLLTSCFAQEMPSSALGRILPSGEENAPWKKALAVLVRLEAFGEFLKDAHRLEKAYRGKETVVFRRELLRHQKKMEYLMKDPLAVLSS